MTLREAIHGAIDALPDEQLPRVRELFEDAEDSAAAAAAHEEIQQHGTVSHEEVKARIGL